DDPTSGRPAAGPPARAGAALTATAAGIAHRTSQHLPRSFFPAPQTQKPAHDSNHRGGTHLRTTSVYGAQERASDCHGMGAHGHEGAGARAGHAIQVQVYERGLWTTLSCGHKAGGEGSDITSSTVTAVTPTATRATTGVVAGGGGSVA